MTLLQQPLRLFFQTVEGWLDRVFTPAWNPFHHFGALGFFYYWIVAISGVYIYIFFDTSTTGAYATVEYLTRDQWYLGGVMRSLHRYASDGLVLMMAVHIVREFAYDRYRGARWYTWVTGVPVLWFVMASGITGYWLVWDQLAQYIAVRTTEWLDWLPIFGEPIARNFLAPSALDDRFFTLMVFLHIAVPLFLLLCLWIHLARVTRPKINPPRGLAVGTFLMLLVLAFIKPAISHAPADLSIVPTDLNLDWYYLGFYPLMDVWSDRAVWGLAVTVTATLFFLPWMPPMRRAPAAVVHLDNCNGCSRCEEDCPYAAIVMAPRSDGAPFDREAVVDTARCVACGICAGACPTATPFRREAALVPGIELAHLPTRTIREQTDTAIAGLQGRSRILVFACDNGCRVDLPEDISAGVVRLPCIGTLPPSFIDYALSRNRTDGVFITGCRDGECKNRFGPRWTNERLAGTRDPRLRSRVSRERLRCVWAAPTDRRKLEREIRAFAARLESLPPPAPKQLPQPPQPNTPATVNAQDNGGE